MDASSVSLLHELFLVAKTGDFNLFVQVFYEWLPIGRLGLFKNKDSRKIMEDQKKLQDTFNAPRDIKKIPPYQKRTDPYEHLRDHWGWGLKHFNDKVDLVYMDQIREHDQPLIHAMNGQLRRHPERYPGLKMADIVPTQKARTAINAQKYGLDNLPTDELRELVNTGMAILKRRERATAPELEDLT